MRRFRAARPRGGAPLMLAMLVAVAALLTLAPGAIARSGAARPGPARAGSAASAGARVLVLGATGHVRSIIDRFLPARGVGPAAPSAAAAAATIRRERRVRRVRLPAPASGRRPHAVRAGVVTGTVPQVLSALEAAGQITATQYASDTAIWNNCVATLATATGVPAAELGAVMTTAQGFAAEGVLTASRVPEVFLTLERNQQWWAAGKVPTTGQRVQFAGSQIVWEYYPGQGIQLQVLGTFGEADGLYTAGPADYSEMRSLVDEMIPLGADRNGALAWEYLFSFENGAPPWTSAMSQGTAIEALTRAAAASNYQKDPAAATTYLSVAHQALAILTQPPPQGVAVPTALGTRYVLYSFNPGEAVINGFLQTLIGLYDYAHAGGGDPEAQSLFDSGNAEAQAEVPSYDTGAWSLYEPGQEDTLSYHQLVTGFLTQLCQRTAAPVYCTTAQHFQAYLTTPPVITLQPATAQAGAVPITFSLSKISNVTVTVQGAGQSVFTTAGQFPHGQDTITVPALSAGTYTVTLAATDLAGNAAQTAATFTVTAPPPPPTQPAPPSPPGPPSPPPSAGAPPPPSGGGAPQITPRLHLGPIATRRLSHGRLRLTLSISASAAGRFSLSLERTEGSHHAWVLARLSGRLAARKGRDTAAVSIVLSAHQLQLLGRRHVRRLMLIVVSGRARAQAPVLGTA